MEPATTFAQLHRGMPLRARVRSHVRDAAVRVRAIGARPSASRGWIRFPYYHHVLDDERLGFERHLRALRQIGEVISLDDAVSLLRSGQPINGRYFCITFDDGFASGLTGAVPILASQGMSAAFFLPTDYIGLSWPRDRVKLDRFFRPAATAFPRPLAFMTWDQCRTMLSAGMTIGAHTASHVRPVTLDAVELRAELTSSREVIREKLKIPCRHMACPWGAPKTDFRPHVAPLIAAEVGYESFLTTRRGPNGAGADPFAIRRDHMLAVWGLYQLRYFLSRDA